VQFQSAELILSQSDKEQHGKEIRTVSLSVLTHNISQLSKKFFGAGPQRQFITQILQYLYNLPNQRPHPYPELLVVTMYI
jgi:hypothetical protein